MKEQTKGLPSTSEGGEGIRKTEHAHLQCYSFFSFFFFFENKDFYKDLAMYYEVLK